VIRRVQQKPGDGSTHWSCRKLASELALSKSTVQRILAQAQLKPHRLQRYMASNDPDFESKAADITGAARDIHALERVVEQESYWFVRLGQIRGELEEYGLTFHNSAIAALPMPSESDWRTGRRNPAFGKSELERVVFRSIYRAVERMLEGWKWVEDTTVNAYRKPGS
jgi:hypothetical protein